MGRPTGSKNKTTGTGMAKPNKRTPTKLRPVQPAKDGKPTQPWKILQDLLVECSFFEKIRDATFRMFWTRDSKADVDGVMLGSRAFVATERERLVAEESKHQHDLTITLPECWAAMNNQGKEQMIFHALLRFAPALKASGEQKTDTKDRLQWRLRRPPIVAFQQEFERYGAENMIGCNAILADAARHTDRPMEKTFDASEATAKMLDAAKRAGADSLTLSTATDSVTIPCGGDGDLETRALALSNAGNGMKKIAKELGVSERQVRKLLGKL